jgi:hypothetical protein
VHRHTTVCAIRHTGGCLQPVLLRGRADYIDGGTGELIHRYTTVHEPGGVLPIAVGSQSCRGPVIFSADETSRPL